MQACAQASPARLSSGTQVAPSRRRSRWQPATVAAACSVSARPAASPRRPLPPPVAVALGSRCSPQRVPSQQQQQPWLPSRQHPRRRATLLPPAALPEALAALESGPARDLAAGLFAAAGSVALIKFFDTLEALGVIDRVSLWVQGSGSVARGCSRPARPPRLWRARGVRLAPPRCPPFPPTTLGPLPQKLSRKLVHTLAGPGFLLCWPLFGAEPYRCGVGGSHAVFSFLAPLVLHLCITRCLRSDLWGSTPSSVQTCSSTTHTACPLYLPSSAAPPPPSPSVPHPPLHPCRSSPPTCSRFVAMCVPALNGLRLLLIGGGVVKDERAVMAVSRTGDPKELLR